MKSKKLLILIPIVLLAGIVAGVLCLVPRVDHGLRITRLLQPVLEAENQTLHMAVSAGLREERLEVEGDVFLVAQKDREYVVLEYQGIPVYVSGNLLFLENGKAFRIGEGLTLPAITWREVLPRIGMLFEMMDITLKEEAERITYSVSITGEQAASLLELLGLPWEGIGAVDVELTEKNEALKKVRISGTGTLEAETVTMDVVFSGFRILAPGDYPIPEAVTRSAATVAPESLFSLTEDLFRLIPALDPFAEPEALRGTLKLTADCGPIQLNKSLDLSALSTASGELDPQALEQLPEFLGWLCLEGDIRCTRKGDAYVYSLALDRTSMEELAGMILPELKEYGGDLTEGSVMLLLEGERITAIKLSIGGEVSVLFARIPVSVEAEFLFS